MKAICEKLTGFSCVEKVMLALTFLSGFVIGMGIAHS